MRKNRELRKCYWELDIIATIKSIHLRWQGYILGTNSNSMIKKDFLIEDIMVQSQEKTNAA